MPVTFNWLQDIADIVLENSAENFSTERGKTFSRFLQWKSGYSMFIRVANGLE